MLSKELASLAHHVELSRAGWRDRAIDYLIMGRLVDIPGSIEPDSLLKSVNESLPAPLGRAQLESAVSRLTHDGFLVELNGQVKLSEAKRDELGDQLRKGERREAAVRSQYYDIFSDIPEELLPSFEDFRDLLLFPLVSELGARTYELLAGEEVEVEGAEAYVNFLDLTPEQHRAELSEGISRLLDPKNVEVRGYVLRLLNAAFLTQATGISEAALGEVTRRTERRLRLRVLVDTNFLFSLIGLHENPADDVVDALHELLELVGDRIDVQLYILPITVDEAKRTVVGYESRLAGFYLSPNIARAVAQGSADLSGITLKYIEAGLKGGKRLSAEEYFRPYHDNLLEISRSRAVELYNESTDPLSTDQAVIDDIVSQQEFEEKYKPEHRRKSYEKHLHDMVLWHFARRKRPVRIESPLDAEFWVATLDFGLLGFDRHKRRTGAGGPPVCIHPTVLLQLLQLWVPRTEGLEIALMNSLQPLLPHEFDRQAEDVTIKILRTISRFEGSEQLATGTVSNILFDGAIRESVKAARNVDEEIEVIQGALAAENRRLQLKSENLEQEADGWKEEAAAQAERVHSLQAKLTEEEATRQILSNELTAEKSAREALESRFSDFEDARNVREAKYVVAGGAVAGIGLGWLLVSAALAIGLLPDGLPQWIQRLSMAISVLAFGASGAALLTLFQPPVREAGWAIWVRRGAVAIWTVIVAGLILEVVGGLIGETLSDLNSTSR